MLLFACVRGRPPLPQVPELRALGRAAWLRRGRPDPLLYSFFTWQPILLN